MNKPKGKGSNESNTELSELMCFNLYSTHHAMNRINKILLKDLGLTYTQFLVLVTLWAQNNQLVSDIGKQLFLESSTLTPLLKRMQSKGYIHRKRDDNDERKVRVTLTALGQSIQKKTSGFSASVLEASGMQQKDFKQLVNDISHLREQLLLYPDK